MARLNQFRHIILVAAFMLAAFQPAATAAALVSTVVAVAATAGVAEHTTTGVDVLALVFIGATVSVGRFLRLREVRERTALSRAQIYKLMRLGRFPRQIPMTDDGRAVCWYEPDVVRWQEERIAAARGEAPDGVAAAAR
jgi:prophage regulatory protein